MNEKSIPETITKEDVLSHVQGIKELGISISTSEEVARSFAGFDEGYVIQIDLSKCKGQAIDVDQTLGLENALYEKELILSQWPNDAVVSVTRVSDSIKVDIQNENDEVEASCPQYRYNKYL